jgi:hypothetical protein
VPWILFAIVGFVLWRRAVGGHWHHHHQVGGVRQPSSIIDN